MRSSPRLSKNACKQGRMLARTHASKDATLALLPFGAAISLLDKLSFALHALQTVELQSANASSAWLYLLRALLNPDTLVERVRQPLALCPATPPCHSCRLTCRLQITQPIMLRHATG